MLSTRMSATTPDVPATHNPRALKAVLGAAFLAAFALLLALYIWATGFLIHTSDNASIILEGQAMAHGNIFMHGWYLPSDSFITTDMPLDALLSAAFNGSQLLRLTPALLYTTAVCCAAYLAGHRIQEPALRWLAMGACAALLAFPTGALLPLVLRSPFHIGTLVASLFAWWAYDRFVGDGQSPVALGVFVGVSALAILGDPLAEVLIPLPVGIVSAWALARSGGKNRVAWSAFGGAALAFLLGVGLRQLLIASGTYISAGPITLASPSLLWLHLQWLWPGICALFHIDTQNGLRLILPLPLVILNAAFLALSLVGFAKLLSRSLFSTDMCASLNAVLSWAIVCSVAAYLFTSYAYDPEGVRFVVPAFFCLGILSFSALQLVIPARFQPGVVLALLGASALSFALLLAPMPSAPATGQPLVTFLERHHLTTGLGSFWAANITTLESGGQIHIIPIMVGQGDALHAYRWHAYDGWFNQDAVAQAQFVVLDSSVPLAPYEASIEREYGAPLHIYRVDHYVVLTYAHPLVSRAFTLK